MIKSKLTDKWPSSSLESTSSIILARFFFTILSVFFTWLDTDFVFELSFDSIESSFSFSLLSGIFSM